MNISQQPLDNESLRLSISIDEQDYKPEAEKKIREFGRTHTIPGFRKGHVPFNELKRRFGKDITADVINDAVRDAIFKYLEENKIDFLGYPVPNNPQTVKMDGPQEFQFDVALLPELARKVDKERHVPFYEIEVTDEMIDEQDKAMRKRAGTQQPGQEMQEDALVKGSIMQLDADGNINQNEGAIQMTNGIVFPLYFKDKEEAKKFENTKVGDKVVFNPFRASGGNAGEIASMLGIDKEIAADMKDDFVMTISEYMHSIPAELSQEYYDQLFGEGKVTSEEDYRAKVKQLIASQLEQNSNNLTDNLFDQQMQAENKDMQMNADLMTKIFFNGVEDAEKVLENERPQLIHELIKMRLSKDFDIKVDEKELLDITKVMTQQQFAQYGMAGIEDAVIEKYAKEQLADREKRSRISQRIMDAKLYAAVREAVTLDREVVSLERFKELVDNFQKEQNQAQEASKE